MLTGQWEGFDEAMKALRDLATDMLRDDVIEAALLEVAEPMAAEMEARLYQLVTRRTGETGAAIVAKSRRNARAAAGEVVVTVGPGARAAAGYKVKFWELGTSLHAARPFMRLVYEEWRDQITPRFVEAIRTGHRSAVQRSEHRAKRQGQRKAARTSPFRQVKRARTKAEFMKAIREWGESTGTRS